MHCGTPRQKIPALTVCARPFARNPKRSGERLSECEQKAFVSHQRALAAARQAVVMTILAKKGWTRGTWTTKAAVGKNCVYEYLDGKRRLSPPNRKAMAEELGLKPEELRE